MNDQELDLEDIRIGTTMYECNQYNGSLQVKVLTEPVKKDGAWTFKGLTANGEIDYLINPDSQYLLGSNFYEYPQFEPVIQLPSNN